MKTTVRLVAGPTASGKNTLAQTLAEKHDLSILSFDSMKIYSDLAIGTASPYTAERTSFNAIIGYPAGDGGPESETALARFDQRPDTRTRR